MPTKAELYAQMADKVAGVFVPAIIAISIITFVLWMIFDGDLSMAINCAVSVLAHHYK